MLYRDRKWQIRQVDDAFDLALLLKQKPWPIDTGFRLGDYLFLNDSQGVDRGQLYAVVHLDDDGGTVEVDLLELAYLDADDLAALIESSVQGEYDGARWAIYLPALVMENGCAAMLA